MSLLLEWHLFTFGYSIFFFLISCQDEKEHLAEFKAHLEGLKRRAKTIVQLKPRNPATAIKGKQPIQAVCDFKQMEVCGSAFSIRLFLQYSPNFDCFMLSRKMETCSCPRRS